MPVGILDVARISNGVRRNWDSSFSLLILWFLISRPCSAFQPRQYTLKSWNTHAAILPTLMFPQMQLCCCKNNLFQIPVWPFRVRVKAHCWGQGKACLHLCISALRLENTSGSSTAVAMKCTAGTFQLDFLTEHYGLSREQPSSELLIWARHTFSCPISF